MATPAALAALAPLFPQLDVQRLAHVLSMTTSLDEAAALLSELSAPDPNEASIQAVLAEEAKVAANRARPTILHTSGSSHRRLLTDVHLFGVDGSRCSYCHKTEKGRVAYMFQAPALTLRDLLALTDRGFTRSGSILYAPDNHVACCGKYAFRIHTLEFVQRRKQRAVMRRFQRYIDGSWVPGEAKEEEAKSTPTATVSDVARDTIVAALRTALATLATQTYTAASIPTVKAQLQNTKSPMWKAIWNAMPRDDAFWTSLALQPQRRKATKTPAPRNKKARSSAAAAMSRSPDAEGIVTDVCFRLARAAVATLETLTNRHVAPMARAAATAFAATVIHPAIVSLEAKGGMLHATVMHAPGTRPVHAPTKLPLTTRPRPRHTFTMTLESNAFTQEAYELYRRYTLVMHKDKTDMTPLQYARFCCVNVLVEPHVEGRNPIFGSKHIHYRIDGTLVAVGVVDLMPKCLHSMYLFFDPDYSFLSLGTVTAVLETEYVRDTLRPQFPDLVYNYLGYYLRLAPKMNYKRRFGPAQVLCSESYTWHQLEVADPMLEQCKHVVFGDIVEATTPADEARPDAAADGDVLVRAGQVPATAAWPHTVVEACAQPRVLHAEGRQYDRVAVAHAVLAARARRVEAAPDYLARMTCRLGDRVVAWPDVPRWVRVACEATVTEFIVAVSPDIALHCCVVLDRCRIAPEALERARVVRDAMEAEEEEQRRRLLMASLMPTPVVEEEDGGGEEDEDDEEQDLIL